MGDSMPPARAGHSSIIYGDSMLVFGGKDEENNKLNDLWVFTFSNYCWEKIMCHSPPLPRSGHSASLYGSYMIVFGGLLEVTKELDDVVIYDIRSRKWIVLFEEVMLSPIKKKYGSLLGSQVSSTRASHNFQKQGSGLGSFRKSVKKEFFSQQNSPSGKQRVSTFVSPTSVVKKENDPSPLHRGKTALV